MTYKSFVMTYRSLIIQNSELYFDYLDTIHNCLIFLRTLFIYLFPWQVHYVGLWGYLLAEMKYMFHNILM